MRHATELRNVVESLFLWDRGNCCWRRWSNRNCWCCYWRRWTREIVDVVADNREATEIVDVVADNREATEIVDVVAEDGFFLLNISATFWECLAARIKLFLPIVYTYNPHTTTIMVTGKWFVWSHSSNVWTVRRPLKKMKEKSCDNLGTTYQEWITISCV